ncbi:MAG: trigger factor [Candidatus Firestonebacteria bacterium RIFOXYC2_FULL_39_67]|nr:MAG: trigger factor [Candidatus Firestonebacteria bacterium RIFOXYD2_FULL_39_29]OGF57059.1 MAG: trigger factor [Candidatus Firestonebacteria bacterium RIFOXYC2_FULL_39_67]
MDIKVNILEEKDCKKVLKIEVPSDRVLVEIENMYSNLEKVAEIPGFRAGKAPRGLIEKNFKQKVEKDVLEKLIASAYLDALKEKNINPIAYPQIADVKFEAGKPMEFTAHVEVRPEIKLGKYKGIKVKKEPVEVKKEDVEKSLNYMRERQADFAPVEGRAVKEGDFVMIDFQGTAEGVPEDKLKAVDYFCEIGSKKIFPEVEAALIGSKVGEVKDVPVVYKADFPGKDLAGKTVVFKVTVKGIKEKKLPALDDEFAKDLGEFKTLDEVKKNIEDGLKKELEQKEKTRVTNAIIDEILKSVDFSAPQSLVDNEIQHLLQDFEGRMAQQGVTYEVIGKKKEEVEKEYSEMALKRVKAYLVLDEIAKAEKIEVSEEEVDGEIRTFLFKMGKEGDSYKEYLKSEKGRENIRNQMIQDKILDFLLKNAELS